MSWIYQGKEFDEGCAICPVLDGPSISNLASDMQLDPPQGHDSEKRTIKKRVE